MGIASRHLIKKLYPLNDNIIVSEMNFKERLTTSGIVLLSDDARTAGIRPRWACVYAVGPEQTDVKIGEWVLVSHGRWTRGVEIEDDEGPRTIRKIDPNDILLISDSKPNDDTMSAAVQAEQLSR
jgi:co-chaperonin GroES (HSP10)